MGFWDKAKEYAGNFIDQASEGLLAIGGQLVGAVGGYATDLTKIAVTPIEQGLIKANQFFGNDNYTSNGLVKGADTLKANEIFSRFSKDIQGSDPKDLNQQFTLKQKVNEELDRYNLKDPNQTLSFSQLDNLIKQSNKDYGVSNSLSEITNEISAWTEKEANKSPLTIISAGITPKDQEDIQREYEETIRGTAINLLAKNNPNQFITTPNGDRINPGNIDILTNIANEPLTDTWNTLNTVKKNHEAIIRDYDNDIATKGSSNLNKERAERELADVNKRIETFKNDVPLYIAKIGQKYIEGKKGKEAYDEVDRESNGALSSIVTTQLGLGGFDQTEKEYQEGNGLGNAGALVANTLTSWAVLANGSPWTRAGILGAQIGNNILFGDNIDKGGLDLIQGVNELNADRRSFLGRPIQKTLNFFAPFTQYATSVFATDQSTTASRAGYTILDNPFKRDAVDELVNKVNADLPEIATTMMYGGVADDIAVAGSKSILKGTLSKTSQAFKNGLMKGNPKYMEMARSALLNSYTRKGVALGSDTLLTNSYIQGFTIDGASEWDIVFDLALGASQGILSYIAKNPKIAKSEDPVKAASYKISEDFITTPPSGTPPSGPPPAGTTPPSITTPEIPTAKDKTNINTIIQNFADTIYNAYNKYISNPIVQLQNRVGERMSKIVDEETKKVEQAKTAQVNDELINKQPTINNVFQAITRAENGGIYTVANKPVELKSTPNISEPTPSKYVSIEELAGNDEVSLQGYSAEQLDLDQLNTNQTVAQDTEIKALPNKFILNKSRKEYKSYIKAIKKFSKSFSSVEGINNTVFGMDVINSILSDYVKLGPEDTLTKEVLDTLNDMRDLEIQGLVAGWMFATKNPLVPYLSTKMGGDAQMLQFLIDSNPNMSTKTRNLIQRHWVNHYMQYKQGGIYQVFLDSSSMLDEINDAVANLSNNNINKFENLAEVKQYILSQEGNPIAGELQVIAKLYLRETPSVNWDTLKEQLDKPHYQAKEKLLEEAQKELGDDSAIAAERAAAKHIESILPTTSVEDINILYGTRLEPNTVYTFDDLLIHMMTVNQSTANDLPTVVEAKARALKNKAPNSIKTKTAFINISNASFSYFQQQVDRAIKSDNKSWIQNTKEYILKKYYDLINNNPNVNSEVNALYQMYIKYINMATSESALTLEQAQAISDAAVSHVEITDLPKDLQEKVLKGYSLTNLPIDRLKEIVEQTISYLTDGITPDISLISTVNAIIDQGGLINALNPKFISNDPEVIYLKKQINKEVGDMQLTSDITGDLAKRLAEEAKGNGENKLQNGGFIDDIVSLYKEQLAKEKPDLYKKILKINRDSINKISKAWKKGPTELRAALNKFGANHSLFDISIFFNNDGTPKSMEQISLLLQWKFSLFTFDEAELKTKLSKFRDPGLIATNIFGSRLEFKQEGKDRKELASYIVDNNIIDWTTLYKKMNTAGKIDFLDKVGLGKDVDIKKAIGRSKKYNFDDLLNINQLKAIRNILKETSKDIISFAKSIGKKKAKITKTFLNTFSHHDTINAALKFNGQTVRYLEVSNSYSGASVYAAERQLKRQNQLVNDLVKGNFVENIGETILYGQDVYMNAEGFDAILAKIPNGGTLVLSQKLDWMNKRRVDSYKILRGIDIIYPQSNIEFTLYKDVNGNTSLGAAFRDRGDFETAKTKNEYLSAKYLTPDQDIINSATAKLLSIDPDRVENYVGVINSASDFNTFFVGDYRYTEKAPNIIKRIENNENLDYVSGINFFKNLFFGKDSVFKLGKWEGGKFELGNRTVNIQDILKNKKNFDAVSESRDRIVRLLKYNRNNLSFFKNFLKEKLNIDVVSNEAIDTSGVILNLQNKGFSITRNDLQFIEWASTKRNDLHFIDRATKEKYYLNNAEDILGQGLLDNIPLSIKKSMVGFFNRNEKLIMADYKQPDIVNYKSLDLDPKDLDPEENDIPATKVTISKTRDVKVKIGAVLDTIIDFMKEVDESEFARGDLVPFNQDGAYSFIEGTQDLINVSDEKYILFSYDGTTASSSDDIWQALSRQVNITNGATLDPSIGLKEGDVENISAKISKSSDIFNKYIFADERDFDRIQKTFFNINNTLKNMVYSNYNFNVSTPVPYKQTWDSNGELIRVDSVDEFKEKAVNYIEQTQKEVLKIAISNQQKSPLERITEMAKYGYIYVPVRYNMSFGIAQNITMLGLKKITFADFIPHQVKKMLETGMIRNDMFWDFEGVEGEVKWKRKEVEDLVDNLLGNSKRDNEQKLAAYISLHELVHSQEVANKGRIDLGNIFNRDNILPVDIKEEFIIPEKVPEVKKEELKKNIKNIYDNASSANFFKLPLGLNILQFQRVLENVKDSNGKLITIEQLLDKAGLEIKGSVVVKKERVDKYPWLKGKNMYVHTYLNNLAKKYGNEKIEVEPYTKAEQEIFDKIERLGKKNTKETVKLVRQLEQIDKEKVDRAVRNMKSRIIGEIDIDIDPKIDGKFWIQEIKNNLVDTILDNIVWNKHAKLPTGLKYLADILVLTSKKDLDEYADAFIPAFNGLISKYDQPIGIEQNLEGINQDASAFLDWIDVNAKERKVEAGRNKDPNLQGQKLTEKDLAKEARGIIFGSLDNTRSKRKINYYEIAKQNGVLNQAMSEGMKIPFTKFIIAGFDKSKEAYTNILNSNTNIKKILNFGVDAFNKKIEDTKEIEKKNAEKQFGKYDSEEKSNYLKEKTNSSFIINNILKELKDDKPKSSISKGEFAKFVYSMYREGFQTDEYIFKERNIKKILNFGVDAFNKKIEENRLKEINKVNETYNKKQKLLDEEISKEIELEKKTNRKRTYGIENKEFLLKKIKEKIKRLNEEKLLNEKEKILKEKIDHKVIIKNILKELKDDKLNTPISKSEDAKVLSLLESYGFSNVIPYTIYDELIKNSPANKNIFINSTQKGVGKPNFKAEVDRGSDYVKGEFNRRFKKYIEDYNPLKDDDLKNLRTVKELAIDDNFEVTKVDESPNPGSLVGLTYGMLTPDLISGLYSDLANAYKNFGASDKGGKSMATGKLQEFFDNSNSLVNVLNDELNELDLSDAESKGREATIAYEKARLIDLNKEDRIISIDTIPQEVANEIRLKNNIKYGIEKINGCSL